MKAELIFVGTELLLGEILNTNAQYLSEQLSLIGVDVYHQQTVGDNWDRMKSAFEQALSRSDVVITSGGLGPTMDDITRDVAAEVMGCPMSLDSDLVAKLEAWFAGRGAVMSENNKRQCMVPAGATVLVNDRGTAPGLILHGRNGKHFILLPGPQNELRPMFQNQVIPFLTHLEGGAREMLVTKVLRFIDIGESAMEDRLKDLIEAQSDPSIAPYAKLGECHLRLATRAATQDEGLQRIAPVESEIRARLGDYLYATDGTTLEAAVGELLRSKGMVVSVAESCTGGWLGKRITDTPGSSDYFHEGYLTYSYQSKTRLLGVPEAMLNEYGAVSEQVVAAMAQGALERSGADVALAISGIAGPGGGTPEKPVGTVCFGLAAKGTAGLPTGVYSTTRQMWGSRDDVRSRSTTVALAMLRRYLLGQKV